jgi:hypothetical protein
MALHAKPSGAYTEGSQDWLDNIDALWDFCHFDLDYSEEAFSGMMGNSQHEGGLNPWRWQGDTYSLSRGYGLFQYTPASGYINDYGHYSSRYAPNLSTSVQTPGASPDDGYAQIEVIPASGKYSGGSTRISLLQPYVPTCDNYQSLDAFKTVDDVEMATYLWLGFFECPGWWLNQTDVPTNFQPRLDTAMDVYNHIHTPTPPTPTGSLLMWGGARENIRLNILRR